jgi:hypothetical protein
MRLSEEQWTIEHLRAHLQYAIDLEFWTIPFYMSAMYSIVDRTSDAFQLIQSVVNQEMLHVQLAANLANAYGLSPTFEAPRYEGHRVPHLDFNLDTPDPRKDFSPFSAEIGPLDEQRIHAMCLIEYPEWKTGHRPDLRDTITEYGSIGEFYDAVAYGARLLKSHLHGGVNQVDHFSAFYRNLPTLTVDASGDEGFHQASLLINTIREQGEGASLKQPRLPVPLQNTADDGAQALPHYEKFIRILRQHSKPLTYAVKPESQYTAEDRQLQKLLMLHFTRFRNALQQLFAGKNPESFIPLMITVGAGIQNCWKHGVTPDFRAM